MRTGVSKEFWSKLTTVLITSWCPDDNGLIEVTLTWFLNKIGHFSVVQIRHKLANGQNYLKCGLALSNSSIHTAVVQRYCTLIKKERLVLWDCDHSKNSAFSSRSPKQFLTHKIFMFTVLSAVISSFQHMLAHCMCTAQLGMCTASHQLPPHAHRALTKWYLRLIPYHYHSWGVGSHSVANIVC